MTNNVENIIAKQFEDYLSYCKLLKKNKNNPDVLKEYCQMMRDNWTLFYD